MCHPCLNSVEPSTYPSYPVTGTWPPGSRPPTHTYLPLEAATLVVDASLLHSRCRGRKEGPARASGLWPTMLQPRFPPQILTLPGCFWDHM